MHHLTSDFLIYRKSRIQEFDMRVRIVHVGQSMPKDHLGVYIY